MAKKRNLIVLGAFMTGQAFQIVAAAIARDLSVSNSLIWTIGTGIVVTLLVGLGMVVAVWNGQEPQENEPLETTDAAGTAERKKRT